MPARTFALATAWLAARGWRPFAFQRQVWRAIAEGRSGLLHATTGAGKTLAVWLGILERFSAPAPVDIAQTAIKKEAKAPPLTILWLTPMRALAADTLRALQAPLPDLAPQWSSGLRTGDTPSGERAAQARRLPTLLVTTPESLSLLIARADARELLGSVRLVVVDEWHELMGNKRGVQVQLALARLSGWRPELMVWGMSATLGNLDEALRTLLPAPDAAAPPPAPALAQGEVAKQVLIDTLLPERVERFAWAGHMGLQMLPRVAEAIEGSGSTLVFTNTRSQAERWYQALIAARPHLAGAIALHHGSLDKGVRDWVEHGLKHGRLKAVVATSSLDLGVDFLPVERVLQIGSCKGVARLLQRAGRSGHAPGRPARITLVPTHSLELVEAAAARAAVRAGQVEQRHTPRAPLDVLVQHLVTVALGSGFRPEALYAEVRRTAAYAGLSPEAWQWCLDFVRRGGPSLAAYPDFHRVVPDGEGDDEGVWRVPDARLARRHRSNIGTIVSDAAVTVQFVGGGRLGTVEESFIARLKPGDAFLFAGRLLALVRVHEMTAQVRLAPARRAALPRWGGGRMPLSSTLAEALVRELAAAARGELGSPEMRHAAPLLALQQRWSALPTPGTLLAETLKSREGWHLFLYPFAGRQVHIGLAGLLAWRAARQAQGTFSMAVNDYGLELLSARPIDWAALLPALIALPTEAPADAAAGRRPRLLAEVLDSLNAGELARRRFREIARIAGLIFQSHPGERRSARQLQASATLYYEVFQKHDPGNQLLAQARQELLDQELDIDRLAATLQRMRGQALSVHALARATPFAFPLMVERLRERLSNEPLAERIARMVAELERAAGGAAAGDEGAQSVQEALRLSDGEAPAGDAAAGKARRARRLRKARP
ncbi:MAG: ligase-associated DNA damage response DEXH box helicase [Ottowia sp.]|uniref:ligase-associated DNA damage response DEXH box helicase n=1 Tax=Ottowia sp. TaxID=1898956 RepID=UPI0039E3D35C